MTDFHQATADERASRLGELARTALAAWDLPSDAAIALVKHRENAVFNVTSGADRFALRVHRAGYHSDAELESELQWIAALDGSVLRTPQVVRSRAGRPFEIVEHASVPEPRQVDLLEWFEGEQIGSIEGGLQADLSVKDTYRVVGELMARTHDHSEHWQRPEGFVRHAWDEEGLLGETPFWGRYLDLAALTSAQKERLAAVKVRALRDLEAFGKGADRYGLIHADLLPENVLHSEQGLCLIDFDDAGFGWHLFDIATSLFHLGESSFDDASAGLVEGYRSQRELPDEHLERLPLFFLLRGITYLSWRHTRPEHAAASEATSALVAAVDEMAETYLSG